MMLVLVGLAVWFGVCALLCGSMMVATGGQTPTPEVMARRPALGHPTSTGDVRRIPVAAGTPERDAA
jgi:hypothetical protein